MEKKNRIDMELTDYMFNKFEDTFDLKIEFLQGEKTKMPDGRWKCTVHISDEKMVLFKEFIKLIMSKPTDQVTVKVMGVEIKQN